MAGSVHNNNRPNEDKEISYNVMPLLQTSQRVSTEYNIIYLYNYVRRM